MKNKYDLTIGMIVKNEEKYLEKCLTALLPLKGLISCEIIITDTGSTDKTVEIAQKLADTVLHFEWCDDFSKARNTGVEIAQGDWFMFIDADEIFDESVVKIAEFIKLRDRDTYDNATYKKKDLLNDDLTKFKIVTSARLFNFTKGRRMFKSEIHECIPYSKDIFNIDACLLHYGCMPSVIGSKSNRNKVILEKQYKKSPQNMAAVMHLYDTSNMDTKIKLAQKAFDIFDEDAVNSYANIEYKDFIFSLYCDLSSQYLKKNKNDLVIQTCERYFKTKLVQQYSVQPNLPTIEIYFMFAMAFYEKKDYKNALKNFQKYQKMYKDFQLNPNTFNQSAYTYSYNTKKVYAKSDNYIIDSYIALNDEGNAIKYLVKTDMYKCNETENLLNIYVLKVIKFNRVDLFDVVEKHYNDLCIEYGYGRLESLLIGRLYFYKDISYFIKNYSIEKLNKILMLSFANIPEFKYEFYKVLTNDIEVDSLEEVKIYIQIAYYYLISQIPTLQEEVDDVKFKNMVEEVFVFFIETSIYYLNETYEPVMLEKSNINNLPKDEAMCVIISKFFENSNTNSNPIEYIKVLKEALIYNQEFKYIILNSINVIEARCNENEFEVLSQKIKQAISDLIEKNEFEQAKVMLEQYKLINPNDLYIEEITKFIGLA